MSNQILETIEHCEELLRQKHAGSAPMNPNALTLVERPHEKLVRRTAFGGWWGRVKYLDGDCETSRPSFCSFPSVEWTAASVAEYHAVTAAWNAWNAKRNEVRPLLSGSARNFLNGTSRRGGERGESREYAAMKSRPFTSSWTSRYIRECVEAFEVATLIN